MKLVDKIAGSFLWRNVVVFLLLHSASFSQRMAQKKGARDLAEALVLYVLFYLLCMFHNMVLYKRFLSQKKYVSYAVVLLLSITVFQALLLAEEHYLTHKPFPPHPPAMWASIYGVDLSYMLLGFCVYYSFHHFKTRHDLLKLQYLRREMELKQLKEQLNPHFLFNALNNIYSYSLEKNSYSKELILQLSELMRFILTNSERDSIPLWEECAFIENYITFEKERLGDLCDITYSKEVEDEGVEVAPFILFTLVENAFKHGTHSTEKSAVSISLRGSSIAISLSTANPVAEPASVASTGIGLSNARRRLSLLYPDKHTLTTEAADMTFTARLTLMLQQNAN